MRVEVLKKKCSYHSAGPGLTGEVDRGLFAAGGGHASSSGCRRVGRKSLGVAAGRPLGPP